MEAKHTPGPWRKCGGATAAYVAVVGPNDEYIVHGMAHPGIVDWAEGGNIESPNNETQFANARLIAAAPQLLQACIAARDRLKRAHQTNTEGLGINAYNLCCDAIDIAVSPPYMCDAERQSLETWTQFHNDEMNATHG